MKMQAHRNGDNVVVSNHNKMNNQVSQLIKVYTLHKNKWKARSRNCLLQNILKLLVIVLQCQLTFIDQNFDVI